MSSLAPSTGGYTGDQRLAPFLLADSDGAAESALADLLGGDIAQLVRDVVRRALGGSRSGAPHIDDVVADVRLRLIRRLRLLRADVAAYDPIENFAAYVRTVAGNTCDAFFRQAFPNRARFRNRVRYALTHHPRTALEEAGERRLCVTQRPVRTAPTAGATAAFLAEPGTFLERHGIAPAQPLPALIDDLLAVLDTPVELDRFVDALAGPLGVEDQDPAPVAAGPGTRGEAATLRDPAADPGQVLEAREALGRTWAEIVELLPRQRAALLLNLRDGEGAAVVHLLPATGVASMGDLADALGLTREALERLWPDLPLDDLAIAGRMGITRQQVINLRKSARARLARRLRRPEA
ncbi:MAG: hypothetical protein AB7O67_12425 [Vicinamibacterales bacterium]